MESQMVRNCSIWNDTWPQLNSTDMIIASNLESSQRNTQFGQISIVGVPITVFLVVFVIVKRRRNILKHIAREQSNAAYSLANETLNQGKQQINNAETYFSTSFPQKKKLNSTVQNMDIVIIEENLLKPKYYANSNGRTIDRATQTRCSLVYKSSIFAKPWDKKCTIKRQGGIWEHRDSDVKVHFQNNSFHHKWDSIEIHGSTFGDIADIRRKFNIDEERHIIAPVVEFTLTITEKLSKYAEVEIPHSMTTNYENIRVQWFASNPYGTIELRDVPHKKDGVHDMMYEITKDRVKVFTTHFSGFVCTVCGKKRDISICATVFGSYLFIKSSEWNVNIRTYLSDQNARIKEFQREMLENESRRKMTQLDQKPLLFEGKLSTDTKLSLAFDIHEDDEENWQHVTKPKTRDKLLHPITQTMTVGEISKCCQRGGVNKVLMDWCLKNVGNSQPDRTFRCFLEIKTSNLKDGMESEEINLQLFLDRTQKGEESLMHETLGSTDPVEKITLCLANELTRSQCIELCREMGSTTLEIDKCNTGYNDVPKEFCYQLLHGCLFKRVKPDQLFGVIEKALPKIGEEVILRKIRDDLRRIQFSAVQEETDYSRRPLVHAVQVTEQAVEVPHEVQCTTDCEETDVKMCSRVEYV